MKKLFVIGAAVVAAIFIWKKRGTSAIPTPLFNFGDIIFCETPYEGSIVMGSVTNRQWNGSSWEYRLTDSLTWFLEETLKDELKCVLAN